MSLLRFFMLLSLVVWIGGIIFFSLVVAPALFTVLPSRHLAGLVVTRSLTLLHWIGVAAGLIFLALSFAEAYYTSGSAQPTAARNVLIAAMVALTLISQTVIAPKMAALRAEMGEIDQIAATDPRRVAFNQLHQWSTGLETAVLVLGLITLYLVARHWAVPVLNSSLTQSLARRT